MTTLRMTLLMLQERAARLEERDRELVATALVGVEQLAATVAEFLDLTHIEAGQLRLHLDVVDVGRLVAHAVDAIRSSAEEAKIPLEVDVALERPALLRGDAARLAVVLSNILTNALKYTQSGGTIRVHAGLAGRRGPPAMLQIRVTDSGPGVPEEFRDRVFQKFFRVEHHRPGTDEGVRGSGIGLYVAREIVEAHGGSIECEAAPAGRGASFLILLPLDGGPQRA
jgi:NtrC-family two-component system sensor histidine kinase KinB